MNKYYKILSINLLFLTLWSCDQFTAIEQDVKFENESSLVEEFYASGAIKFRGELKSGIQDGKQTWYYPSGNIQLEVFYNEGLPNGLKYEYFDNEVKTVEVLSRIDKGINIDSTIFFYPNGNFREIIFYDSKGISIKGRSFYDTGELECEFTLVRPYYLDKEVRNTVIFFDKAGNEDLSRTIDYVLESTGNRNSNFERKVRLVGNFSKNVQLFYGDMFVDYKPKSDGFIDTLQFVNGKAVLDLENVISDTIRFTIHSTKKFKDSLNQEFTKFKNIHGEFIRSSQNPAEE